MASQYRVNVYESEDDRDNIIARVRYNADLDYWDGRNHSNGGVGMHKGITKLKNGTFVIIIGSDWQGSTDYGYAVSKKEAVKEILKADGAELFGMKKFAPLKELYDALTNQEDEDDEEE